MRDDIKNRILKNVSSKVNDLISFFQANGFTDDEIEKKINSDVNGLVSTIKYGNKPSLFLMPDNDKTDTESKENEAETNAVLNDESVSEEIKIVEIKEPVRKKRSRTLKTK